MKRALLAFVTMLCISSSASADRVLEPEACILDALKAGALQQNASMIKFTCVRQYVRAVEKTAIKNPVDLFATSTMQFFPAQQAQGLLSASTERVVVTLKNDSPDRVIFVDVILYNAKRKWQGVFRAYVDYPIESRTIGTFSLQTNSGASEWTSDWGWGLDAVYVTPR